MLTDWEGLIIKSFTFNFEALRFNSFQCLFELVKNDLDPMVANKVILDIEDRLFPWVGT